MWVAFEFFLVGFALATVVWARKEEAARKQKQREQAKVDAQRVAEARELQIEQVLKGLKVVVAIRNQRPQHEEFETVLIGELIKRNADVRHLKHEDNLLLLPAPEGMRNSVPPDNGGRLIMIAGVFWYDSYNNRLHLDMRVADLSGKVIAANVFVTQNNLKELAQLCLNAITNALDKTTVIDV